MNTKPSITTLLVDCDGVLNNNALRQEMQGQAIAPTLGLSWTEAVQAYFDANTEMRNLYAHSMSAEEYKTIWANNDVERFRLLTARRGLSLEPIELQALAKAWRDAWDAYDVNPVIFDDAVPFLTRMKELGLRLVLVSGMNNEERWALLKKLGIDSYFDAVFGTQSIGHQKRDIKFYESVLDQTGVSAEETAIIGDDGTDDIGAGRLGLYTIHLVRSAKDRPENTRRAEEYSFGTPDVVVHDLHEAGEHLKHLIQK